MKYKFLVLIAVMIAIVGCQKNEKKSISQPDKDTKELSGKGYSIQYDSSFRLDESGRNGTEFYLFTPTAPGDDFSENINLIIQNLGVLKYDLNQFITLSEKQIEANGKLIESVRKNENGQEYHILIFETKMNGFDLKFLQYDFVKNDKAYVLTFSAKKDEFENHRKSIEKVMNSFGLE
ncbi:PsbP-related protein [Flavobacterium gilvum]|nr:PsbP-related protein [Flavobacterium gilvum]